LFILDPSKTVICVRNGSSAHQIATVCQRNGPKNTGGTFYGLCDIDDGEQYTVAQSQRRSRTTTSGKKKKKKKKKKTPNLALLRSRKWRSIKRNSYCF